MFENEVIKNVSEPKKDELDEKFRAEIERPASLLLRY